MCTVRGAFGRPLAVLVLAALMLPAALAAQLTSPENFDINRFLPNVSSLFETFHVTETQPLQQALEANAVNEETPILVTETATGKLALLTDQMGYHHIAQGQADGQDWMATF